ncbi:MAG: hypothetical protein AB7O52_18700 [Planctomycetota bacterium]
MLLAIALGGILANAASAQNLDTIAQLLTAPNLLRLVDRDGSPVATAALPGAPLSAARTATGATWVGVGAPATLVLVSAAGGVVTQVPLAADPTGIAIDATGRVWVSLLALNRVDLFSAAGAPITSYNVGLGPRGVAIDTVGNCWVANSLAGTVSRITGPLVFTFPVGGSPFGLAASPIGGVWMTDIISNSIKRVAISGAISDTVAVGSNPQAIALDGEGRIWVTSTASNETWLLSAGAEPLEVYATGTSPVGICIDGRGAAWVNASGSNTVYRINARQNIVTPYPGLLGVTGIGDCTGLARAHVVQPGGDVDGDAITNGAEIAAGCNPFDPVLPAMGRVTPSEVSIEGGAPLTVSGCGFSMLAMPEVDLGLVTTFVPSLVDDLHLIGTAPVRSVTGALDATLVDGMAAIDTLPEALRFSRNPGQAWLTVPTGVDRRPVRPSGNLSPTLGPFGATTDVRGIAVDRNGGVWLASEAGSEVTRLTADGVFSFQWTLPVADLGGIAVAPDGSAWVTHRGPPGSPGSSVYRLTIGMPPAGPFAVGLGPDGVAVDAAGHVWVANADDGSVSRLENGLLVSTYPVGGTPVALTPDAAGRIWVVSRSDARLHRIDPVAGLDLTTDLVGNPTAIAFGFDDRLWITSETTNQLLRVDIDGLITGTFGTASGPVGVAVDGSGAVWVTHSASANVRRYSGAGSLLNDFALVASRRQIGDFTGLIAILQEPTDDHDADGACNGVELQEASDPFRPEVTAAMQVFFAQIDPAEGFMVGGDPFFIDGCGFAAGNVSVLFGAQPATAVFVLSDFRLAGFTPPSANYGPTDLVVASNAGSVFIPDGFFYRTSPITALDCTQVGVGVQLSWPEAQAYDTIEILRDGTGLATIPGGLMTFIDPNPPLGSVSYEVIGSLAGEAGLGASCVTPVVLVPPANLACTTEVAGIGLSWTNSDVYASLILRRDAQVIARLPGSTTQYFDDLPAPGSHTYELRAERDGFLSAPTSCVAIFVVVPVEDLLCSPDFGQVQLQWTSPQPYDSVRIFRNGPLLIELAAGTTSYVDVTVDEGANTYVVAGVLGGASSPGAPCDVLVPVPAVTNVECSAFVFDVTLAWTLALDDYELLHILRDGVEIAALAGDQTTFTDGGLPLGTYEYTIVAENNATFSLPAACTATVVGPIFIRGDANGDEKVNVADAIFELDILFSNAPPAPCADATDANDDGSLNIADPIYTLGYLFDGGTPPPPPFPTRGPDPTADALNCATSLPNR